tara:strand:- start:199890 stop:201176 length:1287 start_codon:yes stop_codon:yes gene_type:complete
MRASINKACLFFILLDNIFLPIDLGVDFRLNYFVMLGYIIYYFCTHRKIKLTSNEIVFLAAGTAVFIFLTVFFAVSYPLVLKQLLLITITLLFSFLLLNSYNFNIERLFKDYIDFIFLAGLLVVVQVFGVLLKMNFLVDYSYFGIDTGRIDLNAARGRFHAWFYEPSFMAYAFTPVVFISIAKLFNIGNLLSKKKAIFIITMLILTRSSIGLLGVLLSAIIISFSKYPIYRKPIFIVISIATILLSSLAMYKMPAVKMRVNETYQLFSQERVKSEEVAKTNLSTYALYSNFKISQAAIKENIFFGTGLGTYELNYDKYLFKVIPPSNWRDNFKINRQDANSLFLRMFVEMGLLGIIFMVYFIWKNRMRYNEQQSKLKENLWCINNGIFVLIILRLLRQGHYTMLGFLLMVLIFYYSKKLANSAAISHI